MMYITRKTGGKIPKFKKEERNYESKKVLSLLMTAALAAGVLTGCGGGRGTEETAQTAETPAAAEETAETESAETAEPEEADGRRRYRGCGVAVARNTELGRSGSDV